MTDLLELAARVEALDGPIREVDNLIAAAVDWKPHGRSFTASAFTASLDAALTLVPEGDDISLNLGTGPFVGPFARIWTCDPNREEPFDFITNAATPALALCAAALRARAANQEPSDARD